MSGPAPALPPSLPQPAETPAGTGEGWGEGILGELVAGLSRARPGPAIAVGILGTSAHAPQVPGPCRRHCQAAVPAGGGLTGGCAFLRAAAAGRVLLPDQVGRCARGFPVAACATMLGAAPAVLVSVAEPATEATPLEPDLQQHLDAAAGLVQQIGQLLEENAGFADEVLQNYEQLNLIFDLTQQITQVTEPHAIERLVLERIARLLGSANIGVLRAAVPGRESAAPPPAALALREEPPGAAVPLPHPEAAVLQAEPQAVELVESVRRTRTVQVAELGGRQFIAGPLARLDERVDVVLAVRPALGGHKFTAGDMLLVQSILTYSGQLIRNSELHERLRRMSFETARALVAAIDKKDHYTSGHSERVGFLTRLIAECYDLSPGDLQVMSWAGLLHDVGKIGIPEEILSKPGKLTDQEFEVIRRHPAMGYEILQPIASFKLVLDGVLYHHEQPDGGGYPAGLVGTKVPLVARLIHVADTFDALTSTRSYRQAYVIDDALAIMRREAGTRLDDDAMQRFLQALEAYRTREPADFAAKFLQDREAGHA